MENSWQGQGHRIAAGPPDVADHAPGSEYQCPMLSMHAGYCTARSRPGGLGRADQRSAILSYENRKRTRARQCERKAFFFEKKKQKTSIS